MILDRIPVRLRLSLGHSVWMAVLFLAVGFGLYRFVEHNLLTSVDAAVLGSARAMRDARFVAGFSPPVMEGFLQEFLGERFIRSTAQLVDLSGKVSASTHNVRIRLPVTPDSVRRAEKGMETFETFRWPEFGAVRQVTLPVLLNGSFTGELIQVGAPLDYTDHALKQIATVLWIAFPLGFVFSLVFGYILTARSLKPVKQMSEAAMRMGIDELRMRLPVSPAKDELRFLAQSFNGMLDRLEDAVMRLRRFAGDVSHELRTPLAVLRGEAELALRRKRSEEDYQTSFKLVISEADNMTRIVEDLLLLARAQSRSVAVTWESIDVRKFVEQLVASVQPMFQARNVVLRVFGIEGDSGRIIGSPTYLQLAVKNILLNAVKHSGPQSDVELRFERAGNEVHFAVRDFGEGISEDALPFIFDPFYRADTVRNRTSGGVGLGLSLALALVELHGGRLSVDSKVGKGSVFRVQIPAEPPARRDEGDPPRL